MNSLQQLHDGPSYLTAGAKISYLLQTWVLLQIVASSSCLPHLNFVLCCVSCSLFSIDLDTAAKKKKKKTRHIWKETKLLL